jgi:hypothetical protein
MTSIAIDVFEPDWSDAPEWANWHVCYDDGNGMWYENCPYVAPAADAESWFEFDNDGRGAWSRFGLNYDADWRNSLRHRPERRA